jgi:hypothetical protein
VASEFFVDFRSSLEELINIVSVKIHLYFQLLTVLYLIRRGPVAAKSFKNEEAGTQEAQEAQELADSCASCPSVFLPASVRHKTATTVRKLSVTSATHAAHVASATHAAHVTSATHATHVTSATEATSAHVAAERTVPHPASCEAVPDRSVPE